MYHLVQDEATIATLMRYLADGACTFGPLSPAPGSGADEYRLRGTRPDLVDPRLRVFAFLRSGSTEDVLTYVSKPRAQNNETGDKFGYFVDEGDGFVVLNRDTCAKLGADANRRLVVRWDDAQLTL